MARPGLFDAELSKTGLFDPELNKGGLFAPEFITTATAPAFTIGDDHEWWAGTQKCMVAVALAAASLATSVSTAQARALQLHEQNEIVPQPVVLAADEDFWKNPVAPASLGFQRLYFPDPEEIPAAALFGQPEEDFWNNPVRPVWSFSPAVVFRDDDVIVPQPAAFNLDEDFWSAYGRFAPVQGTNSRLYLPDPEELPAASLFGQPDEDFRIPSPPQQAAPAPKLFSDDDVFFPVSAPAISDEDYWSAYGGIPLSTAWRAQIFFDDLSVVPTVVTLDEDFWQPQVWQAIATRQQAGAFLDDDVFFSIAAPAILDEDYWSVPRPWPPIAAPRISRDDDVAIPQAAAFGGDEEFRPASPARTWRLIPKVFVYDDVFFTVVVQPGPFVACEKSFAVVQSLAASQASVISGLAAKAGATIQSLGASRATTISGLAAKGSATISSLSITRFEIICTD